jgi:hypothetical protein
LRRRCCAARPATVAHHCCWLVAAAARCAGTQGTRCTRGSGPCCRCAERAPRSRGPRPPRLVAPSSARSRGSCRLPGGERQPQRRRRRQQRAAAWIALECMGSLPQALPRGAWRALPSAPTPECWSLAIWPGWRSRRTCPDLCPRPGRSASPPPARGPPCRAARGVALDRARTSSRAPPSRRGTRRYPSAPGRTGARCARAASPPVATRTARCGGSSRRRPSARPCTA